MKKCHSLLSNSQLQPSQQQQQFRVPMFSVHFFKLDNHGRRAWKLVLERSGPDDEKLITDSVAAVEEQARKIYKDDPEDPLPPSDGFVRLMIESGSLVLLGAFSRLGCALKELDDDELVDWLKRWNEWIFRLNKQVPLVVLKELLKLSYFQELLKSRKKLNRPKGGKIRMILYDQLVEPAMVERSSGRHKVNFFINCLFNQISMSSSSDREPPTLLHALWLCQIGPAGFIIGSHVDDDGNADEDDDDDSSSSYSQYPVQGATELQKAGITFKNNEGKGTRGITFKEKMMKAELSFSPITFEHDIGKLFNHLIGYETFNELGKNQRLVCSYLKLMRELIRSPDDAKVLATQEIVNADPGREEDVLKILRNLELPHDQVGDSQRMIHVRRKIRTYVKPSNFGKVMNLIVITLLTLVQSLQTLYTVLSYHYPRN